MTIADLIKARLGAMGFGPPDLRQALARRGLEITRQSIHGWLSGETRPTPANVLLLWDVLVVPVDERETWMAALALPLPDRRAQDEASAPSDDSATDAA